MNGRLSLINRLLLLLALGVSATGCGKGAYDPKTAGEECGLPVNQHDSFMVRMNPDGPARVMIDGRFSNQERFIIERAISTWNSFGEASSARRPYFSVDYDASVSSAEMPSDKNDCQFDGSDSRFRIVMDNDESHWAALGLSDANPGVTIRCRVSTRLVRQTVFLNLNHTRPDQLESITLHELGHAIGLDHSCAPGSGSRRYAGCGQLAEEHPYRIAVMFPTLRISSLMTGSSETKEYLRGNDRERANCVYSIQ